MGFEGRFEKTDISGIMQVLAMNQRYGVLILVHTDGGARLVFKGGQVVSGDADSTRKLGRRLVDKRLVTEDQLVEALLKQGKHGWKESKPPLGTVLVESGAMKQDALEAILREQLFDVAGEILTWKSGAFFFEPSAPQARPLGMGQGMEAEFLMIEAARLRDEQRARQPALPLSAGTPMPAAASAKSAASEKPVATPKSEARAQPTLAEIESLVLKLSPDEKVLLTRDLLEQGWGPTLEEEPSADTRAPVGGSEIEAEDLEVVPDLVALEFPPKVPQELPADLKAAEDARRLARIIVSDIALYESKALELAVQSGDFEGTLASHLAAGRKLLARRVPAEVLAVHDFLGEAIQDLIKARTKATNPS